MSGMSGGDMPDCNTSTHSHSGLHRDISGARSVDALRDISIRMLDTTDAAIRSGLDTKAVVREISLLNNAITLRLMALLESSEGICLPDGAVYLALGSEGRGEQTLRTDQDSAIVYRDDFPQKNLAAVARFAERMVEALEVIGVPRCPGNIMASNPDWRHSLSEWKQLLHHWITVPTPEHMLNFGIFQDLRPLQSNLDLGMELREYIRASVHNTAFFFPNMASHAARFPPGLGMFGRIRVERRGDNRGKIDIKKAGIFAITVGVSLLALEFGVNSGTTWEKLEFLGRRNIFKGGDLAIIENAFTDLVHLRLQCQLRELLAGGTPTNFVDPQAMTGCQRETFRRALKGVNTFLYLFRNHYLLNAISI